jgi:cytochrome c556
MKRSPLIATALCSLLAASASYAQAPPAGAAPPANRPSPDQQANAGRQALMTVIAGQAVPLIMQARGRAPYDLAVARRNADRLAVLVRIIPEAFGRDTSAATGLTTVALPEIWKDKDGFATKAQDAADKADALVAAAKAGVEADVKKAIGDFGSACGACHDKFRQADK